MNSELVIMAFMIEFIKFYLLVFIHGFRYIALQYFYRVFSPKKYSQNDRICVPPPCLNDEAFGQHHYAKLQHYKFHYVEKGDRSNRLLLLIHGFPEFWYSWRYQLQKLSAYYWVVAIDLKGYGDSDKPSGRRDYEVDVLATEIHGFLAALGRQECTIISHGLGGMVGWHFMNRFPECVESYVAISSPHPASFLQELEMNRVPDAGWYYYCMLPYFPFTDIMKQNLKIFDTLFARLSSNKKISFSQQDMDAFKYTFSRTDDWIGPINYIRSLMKERLRVNRFKKKIRVPTLFIIGNADPIINLEMIVKSSEYLETFTLKIVEGGGHFLPQEMPNYINSLVLDFLKLPDAKVPAPYTQLDGSIIKKMFGAGKNVVNSTVNYGNQVWSTSLDAVSRGVIVPKKVQQLQKS